MTSIPSDRTGILIVRLWLEDQGDDGFRARMSQTLDSAKTERTWTTAGRAEDLYSAVQAWVEAFVHSSEIADAVKRD